VPFVLDLIAAGEAFDDYVFHGLAQLPRLGEEIRTDRLLRSPGGGAVITAIAASRLGLRCGMLGGLSTDAARLLRNEGIRVRNLRRAGEPAPITVAISTPRDRTFVTFNGMNGRLPGRLRRAIAGMRARHVHFALAPAACRPWRAVVRSLRRNGVGTSWDFGWYPTLPTDPHFWSLATSVDYLFVNRAEAVAYAPGARSLAQAVDRWRTSPTNVVIKLGGAGARIVGAGVDVRGKAMTVRVVDTTGAGDAFNAGFLAGRLRGLDLPDALQLANRVGALSTRRAGGLAGLPRKKGSGGFLRFP
jgi:sugar/nucleoside kinase (ribokinase family)